MENRTTPDISFTNNIPDKIRYCRYVLGHAAVRQSGECDEEGCGAYLVVHKDVVMPGCLGRMMGFNPSVQVTVFNAESAVCVQHCAE